MYNTIKNIWLDVTPKVHANVLHDDRIILEQEIYLNDDVANGHGEIGNDIPDGNGEGEGNGEVEGEGGDDEWEDLNEDADADGDVDNVEDALYSIECRTGTFPSPLSCLFLFTALLSSVRFTTLKSYSLDFTSSPLLSSPFITSILSTSLLLSPLPFRHSTSIFCNSII